MSFLLFIRQLPNHLAISASVQRIGFEPIYEVSQSITTLIVPLAGFEPARYLNLNQAPLPVGP